MRFADLSSILALSSVTVALKTLHKAGHSPAHILMRSDVKTLHKVTGDFQLLARQSPDSGSAGDSDYCSGYGVTCASCFGTNWTECPDGIDCYDKTDPTSTCPSDSSSGGSAGGSDWCYGADATCQSCFGNGYTQCSDGFTCYDPSDPLTSCPDSTGSSYGSSTTSSSSESTSTGLGLLSSLGDDSSSTSTSAHTSQTTSSSSTNSSSTPNSTATETASSTSTTSSDPVNTGGVSCVKAPLELSAVAGAAVLAANAFM